MKHEIWVKDGEIFEHHFRISVIDTLIVNVKDSKDKRRLVFVRCGHPQMADVFNLATDTVEHRLCYRWDCKIWHNGTLWKVMNGCWMPCKK